jgi:membrane-bound ClpP family serine protease
MLRHIANTMLFLVLLVGCSVPGGLLVSEEAEAVGGNLFVETAAGGDQFLVLDGEITAATSYAFQALLEQADVEGLVIAQSPGGDLLAAHQIGRAIKARKINTVVLVNCISACVDVFIAGEVREMTDVAELGLHSATDREFAYEIDRRYWGDLGFARVNEQAYQIPNDQLWIIPAKRALQLRLATNIITPDS